MPRRCRSAFAQLIVLWPTPITRGRSHQTYFITFRELAFGIDQVAGPEEAGVNLPKDVLKNSFVAGDSSFGFPSRFLMNVVGKVHGLQHRCFSRLRLRS